MLEQTRHWPLIAYACIKHTLQLKALKICPLMIILSIALFVNINFQSKTTIASNFSKEYL